jgi:hypothetical protein
MPFESDTYAMNSAYMGEVTMADKKDTKEKIKKIYEVLPKLDDQKCGYRTCGEFARAVTEGKAPCYGCVSGGPQVAAKVCAIMGARLPKEATLQPGVGPGLWWPVVPGARGIQGGMGRGFGPGMGEGRGRGQGGGMGRGGGMRRGFGRGRRGR